MRPFMEDEGILHDADTPDDYRSLLEYHNSQLVRPEAEVSLAKENRFSTPESPCCSP